MFDEASNIHMAGLLNVFVNIITKDLQVRVFRFLPRRLRALIFSILTSQVETLTIALTEVVEADAKGILKLVLAVLKGNQASLFSNYSILTLCCILSP